LNVKVLRGVEFIRNTREYTDKVAGRDGEIYFGSEMEAGVINLPCFVVTTPDTWDAKESEIMGYLNPKLGEQALTFANRPGKVYSVVYAGQLKQSEEGPNYRKFTIPFKFHSGCSLADIGAFDGGYEYDDGLTYADGLYYPNPTTMTWFLATQIMSQRNYGHDEAGPVITIAGACTNPTIGNITTGKQLLYTGSLGVGDILAIDLTAMTATLNGANALGNVTGDWWTLATGNNELSFTSTTTPSATVTIDYDHKFL